ncbi:MAG: DUF58 domain-containing protein [Acidimicrobiia bacterium]|nr:DUF58 domain-containing protein [Acidimicrobiia bacterium]
MLTRSGLGAIVAAALLTVLGIWWQYEELLIAAIGIAAIVAFAIWASQRPFRASITRRMASVRVPRGSSIRLRYRVINDSRFRSGSATIIDRCDGHTCRVTVAAIPADSVSELSGAIPTTRRGVFAVGPFDVERTDPLWLSIGTRADDATTMVTVHPKVYDLVSPHGTSRVVENESILRRAATDPLSGFVSMREYVPGDDPRLIHWATSAHTGTLMVREHVEVRRPEFTVLLDTSAHEDPADFEEAVDVAATLAVHGIRQGLDVSLRTTDPEHPGYTLALTDERRVLDLLTPVERTTSSVAVPIATLLAAGGLHATLALVTGPAGPTTQIASIETAVIVRVGSGDATDGGRGLSVADANEFVQRWRGWS